MTNTTHYKNLVVYKKSFQLSLDIVNYFGDQKIEYIHRPIVIQIIKSSSSVPANIAEGHGRYYKKNYRHFLSISRGSSFETEHWLNYFLELDKFDKNKINLFINRNLEIIKMLTSMMKKLET